MRRYGARKVRGRTDGGVHPLDIDPLRDCTAAARREGKREAKVEAHEYEDARATE